MMDNTSYGNYSWDEDEISTEAMMTLKNNLKLLLEACILPCIVFFGLTGKSIFMMMTKQANNNATARKPTLGLHSSLP